MRRTIYLAVITLTLAIVAIAQAPQEKFATVFGAKIRYLEAGDSTKPTVVLLHGLGGNGDGWAGNIPALSTNYHVIAPDQIGFGKSDKPFIKYRIGTYVDFLDKMLSDLKIEKTTLIGNSMGGWIAALYTVKYPNRVNKLILVDSAGLTPKVLDYSKVYQLNSATREEVKNNLKIALYNQTFAENPALIDQFFMQRVTSGDGYTINAIIESIKRNEDFMDSRLSEIKKPTLIIWGKQDGLTLLDEGERYNKGITGSEFFVIDKCGHVPQIEQPLEFTKKVLEFLGK
ncbi:MAG TPA: alpha/beta hydrolase [Pyrinomonadaceae bacterium]|nr:alpha/beta hydrolase [Pyrinomonadaceae bacterium]